MARGNFNRNNKNNITLTKKQRAFCEAYVTLTDFDALSAMKIAGYDLDTKCNEHKTKRELMRNPKVRLYISDLIHEREEDSMLDRAFVIEKLKRVIAETSDKSNYNAHLKAVELLGKTLGMFSDKAEAKDNKDPGSVAKELFEKRKAKILEFKKEGESNGNDEKRPIEAIGE